MNSTESNLSFSCSYCNKRFTSQNGLSIHTNKSHRNALPDNKICLATHRSTSASSTSQEPFHTNNRTTGNSSNSEDTERSPVTTNSLFTASPPFDQQSTTQQISSDTSNSTHAKCQLCGKFFRSINIHISKSHPVDYRQQFFSTSAEHTSSPDILPVPPCKTNNTSCSSPTPPMKICED